MESSNNNMTKLYEFVDKNYRLIKRVELFSSIIFIVGLICCELEIPNTNFILVVGVILTAISFFLQAFRIVEYEDMEAYNTLGSLGFINFIYKLYYFGLSVSMISMLGFIIDYPKGNSLLACGGITLIIILILVLFSKMKDKSQVYDSRFYIRILLCLLILSYLAFTHGIM